MNKFAGDANKSIVPVGFQKAVAPGVSAYALASMVVAERVAELKPNSSLYQVPVLKADEVAPT